MISVGFRRAIVVATFLLTGGAAQAQTGLPSTPDQWLTLECSTGKCPDRLTITPMCVTMPALKLCPGDPPTVWLDPKAEPRDVARRLLEALVQMGFREQ
jgi:hypothetical protein